MIKIDENGRLLYGSSSDYSVDVNLDFNLYYKLCWKEKFRKERIERRKNFNQSLELKCKESAG
jgi:hypothetical protein